MDIKSLEELQTFLEQESSWRKKEIAFFFQLLNQRRKDKKGQVEEGQKTLLRAAWANLYAHWEGFVKQAARAYLAYVAFQEIEFRQLKPNFAAILNRLALKDIENTKRIAPFLNALRQIEGGKFDKKLAANSGVDTTSNLTHEVLLDIWNAIGLNIPDNFELKRKSFDKLLENRNKIVHGERLFIDYKNGWEDYEQMRLTLLNSIEELKTEILNAVHLKTYLR
ncbi:MAE_28990/MAE_18760 family HEPN-like nuclease [Hugenholtzia roseola]|uniref:MAE_28990/MAE_18760 family HEPN-like nuclease n=1 Tax=Hugenholtzia roseola TaxID=1002 RepID=UPI00047E2378|nr:MAE_28990/MAE_18760 family HEPN-like nuclease [Hugenholtzia roseola]